jgi:membrane protein implicated in regulation of membrane protease activity
MPNIDEKQHPGISMHKLPVGGGFIGILFAVGSALIFLIGLPTLWYFVAFSAVLGLAVAGLLAFRNRRHSRQKPLSIMASDPADLRTTRHQAGKDSPQSSSRIVLQPS